MRVQPGDIVFHSGRGVLSNVIRRVTDCRWSHISLVVDVETIHRHTFTVLDVLDKRVIQDIDAHRGDYDWQVRTPCFRPSLALRMGTYPTAGERTLVVHKALDLHSALPLQYPYLELVAYLPFLRRTKLGRKILQRSDRMVCSAMVAAAWHSVGFCWYNGPGCDIRVKADWVGPGTMWRQALHDQWPVVLTKGDYYAR